MRHGKLIGLAGAAIGVAFGGALSGSAPAVADTGTSPIDTWLYADGGSGVNTLPGTPDADSQGGDVTFYYGSTPWYTAAETTFGSYRHDEVTTVLDGSLGYPSVGTVADQYSIDTLEYNPVYPTEVALYSHNHISDPTLGTGDWQQFFAGAFTNFYVSDNAGIEDQVSFFGGQPITVFDFPAAGTGSSEAGDGLGQLMSEFLGGAAASAAVPDLL